MDLESKKEIVIPFVWGTSTIIMTGVVILILLGVVFLMVKQTANWYINGSVLFFVFVFTLYFLAKSPLKLQINSSKIEIRQILGTEKILFKDIVELKNLPQGISKDTTRDFGSGGFFGYIGKFSNEELGNFYMYATELNNLVYIRTTNKKYVISCRDYESLVRSMN